MYKRVLAIAGVVAAMGGASQAADHADGPNATQALMDLSGDITDVFTFNDGSNVVLIMDVGTNATSASKFSNKIQYVFHTNGITGLTDTAPYTTNVVCTFDAANKASCWVQQGTTTADYVTGDASATAGVTSASGKVKVFAGPRNDPFFFNIQGFRKVTRFVADNIAALTPIIDGNGCPKLDAVGSPVSSAAVRGLLKSKTDGTTAGVDDFSKDGTAAAPLGIATISGNVLSLVVSVPKTMLTNNGAKPILGVWASTHK